MPVLLARVPQVCVKVVGSGALAFLLSSFMLYACLSTAICLMEEDGEIVLCLQYAPACRPVPVQAPTQYARNMRAFRQNREGGRREGEARQRGARQSLPPMRCLARKRHVRRGRRLLGAARCSSGYHAMVREGNTTAPVRQIRPE